MKKNELKRLPEMARVLEKKCMHRIVLVYKHHSPYIEDVKHTKLLKKVQHFMKFKECCIFVDGKLIALGKNFMPEEAFIRLEDLRTVNGIHFLPEN